MGHLGTTPWDCNDLGVASETAKVRIAMISAILAYMELKKGLSASMRRVDADAVVA